MYCYLFFVRVLTLFFFCSSSAWSWRANQIDFDTEIENSFNTIRRNTFSSLLQHSFLNIRKQNSRSNSLVFYGFQLNLPFNLHVGTRLHTHFFNKCFLFVWETCPFGVNCPCRRRLFRCLILIVLMMIVVVVMMSIVWTGLNVGPVW